MSQVFSQDLKVKKLFPGSLTPSKVDNTMSNYFLFSNDDYDLPSKSNKLVKTGLSFSIPPKNYIVI